MFSNRTRLLLTMVVVVGAAFIYGIEFTDWHQLEAVTLDGDTVADFQSRLGLDPHSPVTRQPFTVAASKLLKQDSTVKVDFSYDLPRGLKITTNRFDPLCVVVDNKSHRFFGINFEGRVVPLRADHDDWEHPVITGTSVRGVFELCRDPRVTVLMPQLKQLADDRLELYRLVEEVDFSEPDYVAVTVSGLQYRLKVKAEGFFDQVTGFVRFLERFHPDLDSAREFDLRFADMIVQENGKR